MADISTMTLEELTEELEDCWDWDDRYKYIIELGRRMTPLPNTARVRENLIQGCQSDAWLVAETRGEDDPRLFFRADSSSVIVKGLMAVLVVAYSDRTPEQILEFDTEALFDRLDLRKHLSPVRGNGLLAMVKKVKQIAGEHRKGADA